MHEVNCSRGHVRYGTAPKNDPVAVKLGGIYILVETILCVVGIIDKTTNIFHATFYPGNKIWSELNNKS